MKTSAIVTELHESFTKNADMYLLNKRQLTVARESLTGIEKNLNYLTDTKNNSLQHVAVFTIQAPILATKILWAERDIQKNVDNMNNCLPLVMDSHRKLLLALSNNNKLFADGQRVFKLPCGSYTRHIKKGSGYALIYSSSLPLMRYN